MAASGRTGHDQVIFNHHSSLIGISLNLTSLIDRTTQYFLAGATRLGEGEIDDIALSREWFGCSTVPTPGGLCEVCFPLRYGRQGSNVMPEYCRSRPRY